MCKNHWQSKFDSQKTHSMPNSTATIIYEKECGGYLHRSKTGRKCWFGRSQHPPCRPLELSVKKDKLCDNPGKAAIRKEIKTCLGNNQMTFFYYCKKHLDNALREEFNDGVCRVRSKDGTERIRILKEVIKENQDEDEEEGGEIVCDCTKGKGYFETKFDVLDKFPTNPPTIAIQGYKDTKTYPIDSEGNINCIKEDDPE